MKVSVLVSTKNRPKDLAECIDSVISQSVKPIELILVDAGEGDENRKLAEELLKETGIELAYERQEIIDGKVRKTAAWNRACKSAKGDVIVFLDDDVVLEKDYIFNHLKVYENKELGYVAGVQGLFVSDGAHRDSTWDYRLRKLFLLPPYGNGSILPSGFPTYPRESLGLVSIEVMATCNMSVRKEIFNEVTFDEWFHGYSYQEDDDFSYRLSRKYKLYQTPEARLVHKRSPEGRGDQKELAKMYVVNHFYFFKKNMPKSLRYWVSFFWSEFGSIILVLRNKPVNWGIIKGRLLGLWQIIRSLVLGVEVES